MKYEAERINSRDREYGLFERFIALPAEAASIYQDFFNPWWKFYESGIDHDDKSYFEVADTIMSMVEIVIQDWEIINRIRLAEVLEEKNDDTISRLVIVPSFTPALHNGELQLSEL